MNYHAHQGSWVGKIATERIAVSNNPVRKGNQVFYAKYLLPNSNFNNFIPNTKNMSALFA
jgi:hypothetical protein